MPIVLNLRMPISPTCFPLAPLSFGAHAVAPSVDSLVSCPSPLSHPLYENWVGWWQPAVAMDLSRSLCMHRLHCYIPLGCCRCYPPRPASPPAIVSVLSGSVAFPFFNLVQFPIHNDRAEDESFYTGVESRDKITLKMYKVRYKRYTVNR